MQTLEGHTHNVSAVCFHPELPIIITGSEDGTLRVWHSTTYRLENTLNYGLERVWAIGVLKGSNAVAVGYDEVRESVPFESSSFWVLDFVSHEYEEHIGHRLPRPERQQQLIC